MAGWGVAAFIMVVLCCSVSMVSVCLPSDALLQHLPSYLGFSDLGCGVSLHGCSSKAQPLLLTLDEGYLLTAALYDLERGIAEVERRGSKNTQKNCAKKIFMIQITMMV